MAEFQQQTKLLSELTKARDAVRRKYMELKSGKMDLEKTLDETFKPLKDPLNKLVIQNEEKVVKPLKVKPFQGKAFYKPNVTFEPENSYNFEKSTIASPKANSSMYEPDEAEDTTILNESMQKFNAEPVEEEEEEEEETASNDPFAKYMHNLKLSKKSYIDNVYGIRKNGSTLSIGNSPISIDASHVKVNGKSYPTTVGLMELFVRSAPDE